MVGRPTGTIVRIWGGYCHIQPAVSLQLHIGSTPKSAAVQRLAVMTAATQVSISARLFGRDKAAAAAAAAAAAVIGDDCWLLF